MNLYPKTDFPGLAKTTWERLSMAYFESQAKWRHISLVNAIILTALAIVIGPNPPLIIALLTLVAYVNLAMGFMSYAMLQIIRRQATPQKHRGEQAVDRKPDPVSS